MLESSMSSNDQEILSRSRLKRLMASGAISKEFPTVLSVTLPVGKISYEPTEAVKELVWNHDTKQYVVYAPPKQLRLNLEI